MRAARFEGEGRIRWEERPDPLPGPGEVRLRVAYCGACGSDRRPWRGGSTVVPGHEISGTVEGLGAGVAPSWRDRRAAVYIPRYCGVCSACRRGEQQLCRNLSGLIGWQFDGGYATDVVVPVQNLIPLPDDIGLDEAVLALDTLGTTGHGVRTAVRAIPSFEGGAVVLGFGPLGAGAALALQAQGLRPVAAWDPVPARRALMAEMDVEVWDPAQTDREPVLVAEASGQAEARLQALEMVRGGGAVLLLGESDRPWTLTPSVRLRRKDIFAVRTFYFSLSEVPATWELIRSYRPRLAPLLAVKRPLSELADTLERFYSGQWLKPLTYPDSGGRGPA